MVCATRAIDRHGAAKFGGHHDYGMLPGISHFYAQCIYGRIKALQTRKQLALFGALIGMRIPTGCLHHGNTRTIILFEHLACSTDHRIE